MALMEIMYAVGDESMLAQVAAATLPPPTVASSTVVDERGCAPTYFTIYIS
jgi:hypothetical protein